MVVKDGAGQVAYDEFYFMVTGRSQQQQQRMDASRSMGNITNNGAEASRGGGSTLTFVRKSAVLIQARNAKCKALSNFARDFNLKLESIERAY